MTLKVVVNNYVLGARVKSTPTHKLSTQQRLDSKHTLLIYTDISDSERVFIERVLSRKTEVIEGGNYGTQNK